MIDDGEVENVCTYIQGLVSLYQCSEGNVLPYIVWKEWISATYCGHLIISSGVLMMWLWR